MAAHTLSKLPTTSSTSASLFSNSNTRRRRPQSLPLPWLGTNNVSLRYSNLRPHEQSKHRPIAASVLSSLPTANPERLSSAEKVPKWSRKAIKSFAMGELEARKLKYPTTGTEALLMGILIEGTSLASKFLRANGITLFKVRDETIKLLGKAEMYFFSPEHPPLTEAAQRALDWAVDQKLKAGDGGEILTSHLLLGIWSEAGSPGHKIMATLGFNDEKAKELESLSSESGM
ncbi:ATP-dependent Clp protease ATP-binding subunit CLPT2, chloroplastic-like [Corylus avellana]|uniref:ATP-dependent Clp protease ATP-binding subunit CLPT2, chloroplastic-like n=1 Tax=Corylus avellana TaxID=13451 RepID=UPI00286AEC79|nr:ATP-dependent Clp protease ATP-binding subunit CLPT2, chloroplastic-like [Corylus avellana]